MFNVTGRVEISGIDIKRAFQGANELNDVLVSDTKATIPTEDGWGRWEVELFNANGRDTVARITYFHGGYHRDSLRYREVLPLSEDGILFLGSVSESRPVAFFRPGKLDGLCENYFQEFGQKVDISAAEFGPDTLTKICEKAKERDFQQRLNEMGITNTCCEIFGQYECDWRVDTYDHKRYTIVISNTRVEIEDEDQDFDCRKICYSVSSKARWVITAEYVDNGACVMRGICLEAPRITAGIIDELEKFLEKHQMKTFFDLLDNGYALVPVDVYGRPLPGKDDEPVQ